MKKEIKEILSHNNIYDEKNKLDISLSNKPEEFLSGYKPIDFKQQQKIFKKMNNRDEDGCVNFDEIPFLYSNKKLSGTNYWLLFQNGSRVLLKTDKLITREIIEQELVMMYLLNQLGVTRAFYEPVRYRDNIYLATPSFLRTSDTIINPFRNYRHIESSFEDAKKYNNDIFYLKTLLIDFLCGNPDRFPNNYGIIVNTNTESRRNLPKNCPLFDNGESLFVSIEDSTLYPKLCNGDKDIEKIFNYILSNEHILQWVKTRLSVATLDEAVRLLKEEKNFTISNTTYQNFENFFKDSEILLNEALKAKGETPCIKLI